MRTPLSINVQTSFFKALVKNQFIFLIPGVGYDYLSVQFYVERFARTTYNSVDTNLTPFPKLARQFFFSVTSNR